MSIPFTSPIGADWSSLSFLNEIWLGLSERNQAAGHSSIALLTPGADVQAVGTASTNSQVSGWLGVQTFLDALCVEYVDPGIPIQGASAPAPFTLSSFHAAAGISAGWRRSTDGQTFSFGYIQAGDVIGASRYLREDSSRQDR